MLEKRASQQSAKKRKRYINFSDTDRYTADYRNAAAIVTTRVLVKIEEGAKIGTAHSQR